MDSAPTPASRIISQHIQLGTARLDTGTPVLDGLAEDPLWRALAVQDETATGLLLAEGGGFLVGALSLPATLGIESPTTRLYDALFQATEGFHLCRIWHFVPRINLPDTSGLETYRAFCRARADAFARRFPNQAGNTLPAASAVGTDGQNLVAVFAAHVQKPSHFENPLQVSAYHYPQRYGPRAPAFSRATVVPLSARQGHLFLSGTAAIRGHETLAAGDTAAQLEYTLENLGRVAEAAGLPVPLNHAHLPAKHVRVYLRNEADTASVRKRIEADLLRDGDSYSCVRSDVCRSDLAVEVEVTLLQAPIAASGGGSQA